MTIPTYSGIPYSPLLESWKKDTMYLDPLETDMNGGNKRLRPMPGNNIQRITFSVMMTRAQADTFETFAISTLSYGTSRFNMMVWLGNGFASKVVQFAKKPEREDVPPVKAKINFDLWVFP